MDADQATLIKSATIRTGEDTVLLVLYYYHAEFTHSKGVRHTVKDRTFYRCILRHDTIESFKSIAEGLMKDNPAEMFRISDLGLGDDMTLKGKHRFTRYSFAKWLKMKTGPKKIISIDDFLEGHRIKKKFSRKRTEGAFSSALPYVKKYVHNDMEYDLESPYFFPKGIWISGTYVPPPRRKPKIIKD